MNEPQSPRALLLRRHTRALPQLDALRRESLPPPPITWRELLREIFRPHRHAWRALAAVWIALLAFHFMLGRSRPPALANPPPPEAIAAWLAQLKAHDTLAQLDRHR